MKAEPPATLIGLPDLKVGIAGSLELPVVINRSDRNIIGYVLLVNDDTGLPEARIILHVRWLSSSSIFTRSGISKEKGTFC